VVFCSGVAKSYGVGSVEEVLDSVDVEAEELCPLLPKNSTLSAITSVTYLFFPS